MRLSLDAFKGISIRSIRQGFRTFRPALRGQAAPVTGSLLLTLMGTSLELLRPWPLKIVFDRVLMANGETAGLWGLSPSVTLALAAVLTLAVSILIGSTSLWSVVLAARVSRKITTRIRKQVFEHLHRLAFPFHQSSRTGDLLTRLIGDVNAVRDALFTSWVNLIGRGLLFAGTATIMFVLEPRLAILALVPLPLLAIRLSNSSRELRQVARKQRGREGDAASFAAETLRHIRVVKAYAAEDRLSHDFSEGSRSAERAGLRAARISAEMARFTEVVSGAGMALMLFAGARSVLAGRLSPGSLLVFMSYARALYKPLRKISGDGARLSKASACIDRLLEVLKIPPEDFSWGWEAPEFRGRIEVRDVHYRYPTGKNALEGISVAIEPGSLVLIRGPNGSGKSTLLSMLLRLIRPQSGSVLIDDQSIEDYRLDSYRNRFAYVPQEIQLFAGTVRENIRYGRPDASDWEVETAARSALLHPVIANLPQGYETVLGENGATLSGGEGRRLMLARAALRRARIILLDEPLAGLDPEARSIVAMAIRTIAAGRTTLVVSHGPAAEIDPDDIYHLDRGRIVSMEQFHRQAGSLDHPERPPVQGAVRTPS